MIKKKEGLYKLPILLIRSTSQENQLMLTGWKENTIKNFDHLDEMDKPQKTQLTKTDLRFRLNVFSKYTT